jgi:hypothetical protein
MPLAGSDGSTLVPFGEGSYCVTVQHPLGCIAEQQCESVTAVDEISGFTIQLFAFENGFRVVSPQPLESCRVYDATGKLLADPACAGAMVVTAAVDWVSGFYLVECRSVSKRMTAFKVLR